MFGRCSFRSLSGGGAVAGGMVTTALALALAVPAAAQAPTTYRRAPGDTLRYHELTEGKSESKGQMGGTSSEIRREATVGLTFLGGDDAQAWFEALSASMKAQGRENAMPTEGVLNRPFALRFGANGEVQVEAGPGPGASIAQLFPKLPERPLAPGVEWADTSGDKRDTPDGAHVESQLVVRYRVLGDTAVAGGRALVIAAKGEGSSRRSSKGTDGASMESRTRTTETGRIVFSTDAGRLLSWEKTVERTGRTTARTGSEDHSAPMARNPNQRVEIGNAADRRATELHDRMHTLIELLPAPAKAAPATP